MSPSDDENTISEDDDPNIQTTWEMSFGQKIKDIFRKMITLIDVF